MVRFSTEKEYTIHKKYVALNLPPHSKEVPEQSEVVLFVLRDFFFRMQLSVLSRIFFQGHSFVEDQLDKVEEEELNTHNLSLTL